MQAVLGLPAVKPVRSYSVKVENGEATLFYEESRNKVQKFINAGSSNEIIFTRRTTESINLAAASWGRKYLKQDCVECFRDRNQHKKDH